jgi:hypothetical protein
MQHHKKQIAHQYSLGSSFQSFEVLYNLQLLCHLGALPNIIQEVPILYLHLVPKVMLCIQDHLKATLCSLLLFNI